MLINLLKKIIKAEYNQDLDAKIWIQKILLKKNFSSLKY
tara:strand:+ start:836 stop:952 length:117 start_codon:yes stop_codon:yes gene_type:complete